MTIDAAVMLDAALDYASRNVPVFPVWGVTGNRCGCGKYPCGDGNRTAGKHPLGILVANGAKEATTDPTTIRAWWGWHPTANLGTPTSWCAVLDVDPRHGGDDALVALEREHSPLPETAEVLTGGGGRHVYFRPVPRLGPSAGKVGPGLDIKSGPGAYILLPPSSHVSGGVYRDEILHSLFETALAPMPDWLVALAIAPANSPNSDRESSEATDWAALLAGAPEGQRHAVAVRIAGHLLGKKLPPAEVEQIVLGFAARCTPPFPADEVRRIVRDLAGKDAQRAASAERAADPPRADGPVLVRLADVQAEDVEWLWPGRVPRGKLVLIIGEPGEGKSYVMHDSTARITRGLPWPDGNRAPQGRVIILTGEDGIADTVRPRVDRQGGDPACVYILRAVRLEEQECPFSLERDLPALEQALTVTEAVLVIIDPLSAYLGSKDSYKDSEIRGILSPLAALAERARVAVVGVLHLTKAAQRRLLLRAQGSIAFVAAARTVLAVGEDPDMPGRRLFVPVKNNLGPMPPALAFRIGEAGLVWEDGPVEGSADRLLAVDEPGTRTDRRERDHAAQFLRDALVHGPVASKEVMADGKANGISQRTLWRAKADLGVVAERQGRAPWYWMLPRRESAP